MSPAWVRPSAARGTVSAGSARRPGTRRPSSRSPRVARRWAPPSPRPRRARGPPPRGGQPHSERWSSRPRLGRARSDIRASAGHRS